MAIPDPRKELVQSQFGAHAAAYVGSDTHAKGASLARLVELLAPQREWQVLDIATAAGHTALALAPHVAQVTATDITPEMLPHAAALAKERGITNITLETADAEDLPYSAASFDLVTCRIAPHHFPHIDRFVAEASRVLKSGGLLAVVDNVVPDPYPQESPAQDETAQDETAQPDAERVDPVAMDPGEYINAFEALRDPSHIRALSPAEWRAAFQATGLVVEHEEIAPKAMTFTPWAERMGASPETIEELRRLLQEAPPAAAAYFALNREEADWVFYLHEAIIIGRKP